jgi:hypothetical protein
MHLSKTALLRIFQALMLDSLCTHIAPKQHRGSTEAAQSEKPGEVAVFLSSFLKKKATIF